MTSTTNHGEAHELSILRTTDGDTDASSRNELAQQIAQCDDCLAYVSQTIETLTSVAGKRRTKHLTALDELMDDVMVLRAGVNTPRRQLVPAGD